MLATITDEDETVWETMFDNENLMLADRVPVGAAATTPWTWKGFGRKEFNKLKKNPSRVAIYDESFEIWGYKMVDYAPKLVKYINANYSLLPNSDGVYVRNDYYDEALKKLGVME